MTDEETVPVAVVGAGNMGSNHVRVYEELPEADLVEVVEKDPEIAAAIEDSYDVEVLDSVDELEMAEATTVAVPNRLHRDITVQCIERDLDVLVEKPLAENVEEAEEIVEAAETNDVILQVGHIERFNPAVELLGEILQEQELIALEAHRLGPFNEQLSEESVVFDLMIHDIDIVCNLANSGIESIDAVGSQTRSDELDHVFSQMEFSNEVVASLTASHVTHGKIRELDVTTSEAYINLDYQKQDVVVNRRGTEQTTSLLNQSGYRTEAVTENPYVKGVEPLKNELETFIESIKSGGDPEVNGFEGLRAVDVASQIVEEARD